jgi:heme/copper-type cytochrome/quinol oxidase subunit 2
MMTMIEIGLLIVYALPTAAYKGLGTRPIYLAATLVALVCAGACTLLIPSQFQVLNAATPAERAAAQFLFDYAPLTVVVWLAVAFGCVLAVILYRPYRPRASGSDHGPALQ